MRERRWCASILEWWIGMKIVKWCGVLERERDELERGDDMDEYGGAGELVSGF